MLAGVAFFIVSCLAILLVTTIEQFIAMRFLQGIGLCFIGAVGYATIQESFEESVCIKITALMANVALIAPLLGPLAGAALIHVAPWQSMFVLFAALAAIAFYGLWKAMPETATLQGEAFSAANLWRDYRQVLGNRRFLCGALAIGFASLPLLALLDFAAARDRSTVVLDREGKLLPARSVEEKLTDPQTNINAGARYLADQGQTFETADKLPVEGLVDADGKPQPAVSPVQLPKPSTQPGFLTYRPVPGDDGQTSTQPVGATKYS